MSKNGVDGVYDADPKKVENAKKYDKLTYMDLIRNNLQVMDQTAATLCMQNGIDMIIALGEDPEIIGSFLVSKPAFAQYSLAHGPQKSVAGQKNIEYLRTSFVFLS